MNANSLLNMLLSAGQSMAQQGKDIAEQKLNLPQEKGERSAMMSGMGKGALAAGALALLLGTSGGRKVTGSALKIGSLAALGGLAYKAYKQWQGSDDQSAGVVAQTPPQNLEDLSEQALNARSKKLLQAMIAAAKADGHIDDNERQVINELIAKLGESNELATFIQSEMETTLSPAVIAQDTDEPGLAAEVYMMSKMVIDEENFIEKTYLSELSKALNLEESLVAQLDKQVEAAAA